MNKSFKNQERNLPFVSVVIPTCNRPEYLPDVLRSLLLQDYPESKYEIIVVDNSTLDDTRKSIKNITGEKGKQINLKYVAEKRSGLVYTRHTGAKHATGEILIFGDDDAIFDSNWISAIIEVFQKFPEVGAVGTKIQIRWDHPPETWVRDYEKVLGKLDYGNEIIVRRGLYINGGSFSIRKELLLKVGGFNPGQKGSYILGDSETGLCRKLFREGILIGWTPAATMWHLQNVETHGKLKDIKRRFRNNGIADAYFVTFYTPNFRMVFNDIIKKAYYTIKQSLQSATRMNLKIMYYDATLNMSYFFWYLKYLYKYRFDSAIRSQIYNTDWVFNLDYQAPPAELVSVIDNNTFKKVGS